MKNKLSKQVNLTLVNGQQGPIIGNSVSSSTTVPYPWKDKKNVVFWDCPGFDDNKGAEQDISNALFIQKIF